ncbi:hypothetical protein B0A49_06529 [Cryomyces minteri]|uniref:Uncharacterized protein n=1 Tax=Cryomyces minteri TaxID=331657 RepID=A0A4U0WRA4_9PEZI|nr:hypothetical protein B0A49_06529 [Cryomyces minteri]
MACIVTGFPSKIAALQFEWAWQNTHTTRHIPAAQRITQTRHNVRFSPRSGRVRKRMARPPVSLTDKLANLHLLLRVKSFARWPLDVRFFAPDVWKMWGRWNERAAGKIREGIGIELVRPDEPIAAERIEAGAAKYLVQGNGVLEALDVGYASLKAYLEKSKALLSTGEPVACTKEIDELFKKRRVKKGEAKGDGWEGAVRLDQGGDNDDEDAESEEGAGDIVVDYEDVEDNESDFIVPSGMHVVAAEEGSQHRGDWIRRANYLKDLDDTLSMGSGARDDVGYFSATGTHHVGQRQGLIVEDSDWDDAEFLD